MTDPTSARALRRLFLTLFLRGRSSRGLGQRGKGAPKSVGAKLALTLLFYAAFGLLALRFGGQPIFTLSLYVHAMALVFLGMFVATSAGEVLFNKEEGDILLHRPIAPRDLLWAKISVLLRVSFWLAGAFHLTAFFVGAAWSHAPLYPLAHALSAALEALFCTGGVVLLYQLCLRWCGRERLDALMTAVQTLVSILFVLAGQLAPRLLILVGADLRVDAGKWWIALLPPAWFAGFDDALAGTGAPLSWALGGVGVLLTAVVLRLAFGKLADGYGAGLQSIGETAAPRAPGRPQGRWLEAIAAAPPLSWIQRNPVERAAFCLTAAYLWRDRETKLRLYPGLAPSFVLPIILLLPARLGARHTGTEHFMDGFQIAFAGGYLGIVPLLALGMLHHSQQWAAADVFRSAPMPGPGPLCHGARRAALVFLALPAAIFFAAAVWLLTHDLSRLTLLLPGMMLLPVCGLGAAVAGQGVPLSKPMEEGKASARGLVTLGFMLPAIGVSLLASWAAATGWFWPFLGGEALVVAAVYAVLRAAVSRSSWPRL